LLYVRSLEGARSGYYPPVDARYLPSGGVVVVMSINILTPISSMSRPPITCHGTRKWQGTAFLMR
jgi:hypothetical protein